MSTSLGTKVPELSGITESGEPLTLSQLRGGHVVVYFYPKDNTPGCTREAGDFRDLRAKFQSHGCTIIGVSRDSVASHGRFHGKHELGFALIADTDEAWCRAFDVIGDKILYGKHYTGVIRSTFLMDPDGILIAEWRSIKVPGHAAAVLERLTHA
ncbi:MAG: peroxiredoxin [Dokdonella sp.]|uniref:peroxiredoxin n=1 Tax=Dokdonella sp. TaxID=2291710 RepID=UPI003264CA7E